MFDWYVILAFGAFLVIYSLEKIAGHHSLENYFAGNETYGIKTGTILIWGILFTSWTVILPIYSSVVFGLGLSFIALILFLIIILIVLSKMVLLARKEGNREKNLMYLYESSFNGKVKGRVAMLLVIANMDGLIIHPMLAGWLYSKWFNESPILFLILLFVFIVLIGGLGGMATLLRTSRLVLWVSGLVLILLPSYMYLGKGIGQAFQQYDNWQDNMQVSREDYLLFLGMGSLFVLGRLITSNLLWHVMFRLKRPHHLSIIRLGVVGSSTIPLALIAFFSLFSMNMAGWDSILKVFEQSQPYLIIQGVLLIWLVGIAHSGIFSLHSQISILTSYIGERKKLSLRSLYFIVLVVGLTALIATSLLIPYTIKIAQCYFFFITVFSLPSIVILCAKDKLVQHLLSFITIAYLIVLVFFAATGMFSKALILAIILSASTAIYMRFARKSIRKS